MKFGILKSKIENVLLESYKDDTFKSEIKNFKKLVLENKNISKLFYLYDELSDNKGLDSITAKDYIDECTVSYNDTIKKINSNDLKQLKTWLGDDKTSNLYESVDNLFNGDVLNINRKIESKKEILEGLQKQKLSIKEPSVNIPLKSMINVANKTLSNYISSLNEEEKNELTCLLSENDDVLNNEYVDIKSEVVEKLNKLIDEESDIDTKSRINETLNKVSEDEYNKVNYYRLKNLNKVL